MYKSATKNGLRLFRKLPTFSLTTLRVLVLCSLAFSTLNFFPLLLKNSPAAVSAFPGPVVTLPASSGVGTTGWVDTGATSVQTSAGLGCNETGWNTEDSQSGLATGATGASVIDVGGSPTMYYSNGTSQGCGGLIFTANGCSQPHCHNRYVGRMSWNGSQWVLKDSAATTIQNVTNGTVTATKPYPPIRFTDVHYSSRNTFRSGVGGDATDIDGGNIYNFNPTYSSTLGRYIAIYQGDQWVDPGTPSSVDPYYGGWFVAVSTDGYTFTKYSAQPTFRFIGPNAITAGSLYYEPTNNTLYSYITSNGALYISSFNVASNGIDNAWNPNLWSAATKIYDPTAMGFGYTISQMTVFKYQTTYYMFGVREAGASKLVALTSSTSTTNPATGWTNQLNLITGATCSIAADCSVTAGNIPAMGSTRQAGMSYYVSSDGILGLYIYGVKTTNTLFPTVRLLQKRLFTQSPPQATVKAPGNPTAGGTYTTYVNNPNTFTVNVTDPDSNLGTHLSTDPAGVNRIGQAWVALPVPLSASSVVFTETTTDYVSYGSLPYATTTAYNNGTYSSTNCGAASGNCTFNVIMTFTTPGTYVVGVNAYDNTGAMPNTNKCSGNTTYAGYGSGNPWEWVRCDATNKDYVTVTVIQKPWISIGGSISHSQSRYINSVTVNNSNESGNPAPAEYMSFNNTPASGNISTVAEDYGSGFTSAIGVGPVTTVTNDDISVQSVKFTPTGTTPASLSLNNAPTEISNTGSFAYSVWLKPTAFTNGSTTDASGTFFIDRTSATVPVFSLKASGGKYTLLYRTDDGSVINGITSAGTSANIALNTWTHVVMERDTSVNLFKLYVNGVLAAMASDIPVGTYNVAPLALTPPAPKLGGHNVNCATTVISGCFSGQMDEFKIYNVPLSDTQVLNDYNTYKTLNSNFPTANYFADSFVSTGGSANPTGAQGFLWNSPTGINGITSYGNMAQNYLDSNAKTGQSTKDTFIAQAIENNTIGSTFQKYIDLNGPSSAFPNGITIAGTTVTIDTSTLPDRPNNSVNATGGVAYFIQNSTGKQINIVSDLDDPLGSGAKQGMLIYINDTDATAVNVKRNSSFTPSQPNTNSSVILVTTKDVNVYSINNTPTNNFAIAIATSRNINFLCTDTAGVAATYCQTAIQGFLFAGNKVTLSYVNTNVATTATLDVSYTANYISDLRKIFVISGALTNTVGFDY